MLGCYSVDDLALLREFVARTRELNEGRPGASPRAGQHGGAAERNDATSPRVRLPKIRVYEMTDHPTACQMIG